MLDDVAVVNISKETNHLRVLGNAGDGAVIGAGWVFEGLTAENGVNFVVYTSGAARLLIEEAVAVQ